MRLYIKRSFGRHAAILVRLVGNKCPAYTRQSSECSLIRDSGGALTRFATIYEQTGQVDCGRPWYVKVAEEHGAAIASSGTASISEGDVRRYLSERIANYKIPRRIIFDSELPREESGKIVKAKLATRYSG